MSENNNTNMFPENTETIDLPSGGLYYPEEHPLSKGNITLKYPTTREEDILLSKKLLKNNTVINEFIQSLIVDLKTDVHSILACDMNLLILASRMLTYGANYSYNIDCPVCNHSHKNIKINLNTLTDVNPLKEEDIKSIEKYKNEFEFILPKSNKKVIFQLLSVKDNMDIEYGVKHKSKYYRMKGIDPYVTLQLKKQIISIDGLTGNEKDIEVEKLLSLDSLALREYINSVTPSINTDIDFVCEECDHEEEIGLPLGKEFF